MTQENKELLLKDLCARLPYGVKLQKTYEPNVTVELYSINTNDNTIKFYTYKGESLTMCDIGDIERFGKLRYKPYLFPMSSMTDEQKEEYHHIVNYISPDDTETWMEGEFIYVDTTQFLRLINFYHRNHLDYRGLINGGLALDATGLGIY